MKFLFIVFISVTSLISLSCFADDEHDPNTEQQWHSGYRYFQKGWINLHIEGAPYERGLQHGRLLSPEIADYTQALAKFTNPNSPFVTWKKTRHIVNTLFLKKFTAEQLQEMKGIADGANAAGAKFDNRSLDITDIAILNLSNELDEMEDALAVTPIISQKSSKPVATVAKPAAIKKYAGPIRCNAFAAVGPATKDGKIVFGHLTMFSLYPATFYNVWIDVKPDTGHHFVMQTTPGGIHSGMDYSINDAGILLSETSVDQTSFDAKGIPLASRIRQAQQYANSIEEAVAMLQYHNNGLSTAEWILADIKRNEIALLTLGTHQSKLYRSSKKEWIAGAEGFYWSNNNIKDQNVRLETIASVNSRPSTAGVFQPEQRDAVWLRMYDQYKGNIDAEFGKKILTTPEIVASVSVDAKYTTSDMAAQLKTWATFGPPLGVARYPSQDDLHNYPSVKTLITNPWTILNAIHLPQNKNTSARAIDLHDPESATTTTVRTSEISEPDTKPAWHGTLLPKTDADIWFTTAFANYERIAALENTWLHQHENQQLSQDEQNYLDVKRFYFRSLYELRARAGNDFPLSKTKMNFRDEKWVDLIIGKGVLLLDNLRKLVGRSEFDALMDQFGRDNAGKAVSVDQFQHFLEKKTNKELTTFFNLWLNNTGLPNSTGSPFAIFTFDAELNKTIIVYGTQEDRDVNLEAAQALQQTLKQRKHNVLVAIKADDEISEKDLKSNHIILIGRTETNRITARFSSALPIKLGSGSFQVNHRIYAHPESALVQATENPLNPRFSVVSVAGMGALATLNVTKQFAEGTIPNAPIVLLPYQQKSISFVDVNSQK